MKAIDLAKKQRKQRQRALGEKTKPLYTPPAPTFSFEASEEIMVEKDTKNEEEAVVTNSITPQRSYVQSSKALSMDDIILFLSNLKNSDHQSTNIQQKNDRLKMENKELSEEIAILKKQLEQTEREFQTIQEDYQALVKIMDRARKMVLFEDEEKPTNTFKMDKNGNLERIAK